MYDAGINPELQYVWYKSWVNCRIRSIVYTSHQNIYQEKEKYNNRLHYWPEDELGLSWPVRSFRSRNFI